MDDIHRVLFNDGVDIAGPTTRDSNYDQRPDNTEYFTSLRYNPDTNEYTVIPFGQNIEATINKDIW